MERNRSGKNERKVKIDPKTRARVEASQIAEVVLSETGIPDERRQSILKRLAQAMQMLAINLSRHEESKKKEE